MTTTFVPTVDPISSITAVRSSKRSLGLAGLGAGAVAGAATMVVAAIAQAADVSLKLNGSGGHPAQAIPLGGFATMTLAGAAAGILIAAGARRWTHAWPKSMPGLPSRPQGTLDDYLWSRSSSPYGATGGELAPAHGTVRGDGPGRRR